LILFIGHLQSIRSEWHYRKLPHNLHPSLYFSLRQRALAYFK
jgi:hypothetical protein